MNRKQEYLLKYLDIVENYIDGVTSMGVSNDDLASLNIEYADIEGLKKFLPGPGLSSEHRRDYDDAVVSDEVLAKFNIEKTEYIEFRKRCHYSYVRNETILSSRRQDKISDMLDEYYIWMPSSIC